MELFKKLRYTTTAAQSAQVPMHFSLIEFVVGFIALVVSVGVHEFSHVLSAHLQGDDTGKNLGRLTLNPIVHLDPLGTLFMAVSMYYGLGVGWGKPAPFNPFNLRNRRWGPALVAVAGPISNLCLLLVAGYILLFIGSNLASVNLLFTFLRFIVIINASLAVFNLLPISPLDGSHLLEALTSPENGAVIFFKRYGFFILLALIFFLPSFLNSFISIGVQFILHIFGLSRLLGVL